MRGAPERLAEILADFKSSERDSAPLGKLDAASLAVLRAWPQVPIVLREPMFLGGVPMHRGNRWKYAWAFRVIDWADLAARCGLGEGAVRPAAERLVAEGWLMPDGTLHPAAAAFVEGLTE